MSSEREHRLSMNLARIKLPRDEGALMSYGGMCVKSGIFIGKKEALKELLELRALLGRCNHALNQIDYVTTPKDIDDLKRDIKNTLNK